MPKPFLPSQGLFGWRTTDDFSEDVPRLGTSGGINSGALLCYLASEHPPEKRPRRLLMYYAHLREHSPGTMRFVKLQVRYAREHFPAVEFGMQRASVVDFFEAENFIPHPLYSPCTEHLKVEPMERWSIAHGATLDLIGYVRHERKRQAVAQKKAERDVAFPIANLSEEDCFALVRREIGWYPPIYDIRENGKRVFSHNNCLPCKNMTLKQLRAVAKYYPRYFERAMRMAERIGNYWGRPSEYAGDPCALCVFD
jgi:hypothetical protein